MACASGLLDLVAQHLNISKYFYRLTLAACPQQRDQQLIQCEAAFLITASTPILRICHRKKNPKSAFPPFFLFRMVQARHSLSKLQLHFLTALHRSS